MDRPRPRQRQRQRAVLSGFTKAEIKKMEKFLMEPRDLLQSKEFCQKIARNLSSSACRAGKPSIKWTEVQSWFLARQKESTSKVPSLTDTSKTESKISETCSLDNGPQISQFLKVVSKVGEKIRGLSELQFEAKSSKDGAWYDVDTFLRQRLLGSGEAEVLTRFVGFGADEDEWVNVKNAVRLRSIPFEHSECNKLAAGDLVLCLQEKRDQLIYHDVHVIEIERKTHDIRGCRCIFLIRHDHDGFEERVRLRRLFKIQGQQIRLFA
ncbi:DNA-binding transcription factor 1, SAWADEE homeodomain homolog 1 [Hibiscus trionum]|uniref:DNA-binding transcription factor 1, SAWADEE homeodomain homolog 1 n=1 Tax=Hibiscus trionum TaxID=183268 RepID=A0A9W7MHA2_HIBTR|nr:DNA-binding transcription factor 1, SAWADEE homeodomain homolog 1 [Hibiscus trionum]